MLLNRDLSQKGVSDMELTAIDRSDSIIRSILEKKIRHVFRKKISKILFVVPPEIPKENFRQRAAIHKRYACFPPYGPGVLAQHLLGRGYTVQILDLNYLLLFDAHTIAPEKFSYDRWRERLTEKLEEFSPDAVGISCMFTMGHEQMVAIANLVKGVSPDMPVIAGGVHPSNASEAVLKDCPNIDFIQLYEAGVSFPDMLDIANGTLPVASLAQTAAIVDGEYTAIQARAVPSGDQLDVVPEYFALPVGQYDTLGQIGAYTFMRPVGAFTVLSNTGCRARCSFCSVRTFNGSGVRTRSIQSTVDEIEYMVDRYGTRHVMWLDDDLLFSPKRTINLFNEIVRRNLRITWDATNGLIAAALTEEIVHAASESGCIGIALGIESGSPEILRAVHKPGTVDSFRRAKELLAPYPHIFVRGFLIIGFPNETMRQLLQTLELGIELDFDWYPVQVLNLLPSTEIYKTMIEQGLLEDGMRIGKNVVIGPAGKQRLREEREKIGASDFFDLFGLRDPESLIRQEDLPDLWFLMDYKLNYEKILRWTDRAKLELQGQMLRHVCDRLTSDIGNPLANLFLALCEDTLGDASAAKMRIKKTEQYLAESDYWQKRFEILNLNVLLRDACARLFGTTNH